VKYLDGLDVAYFSVLSINNFSKKSIDNPMISIYEVVESENSYSYLALSITCKYNLRISDVD